MGVLNGLRRCSADLFCGLFRLVFDDCRLRPNCSGTLAGLLFEGSGLGSQLLCPLLALLFHVARLMCGSFLRRGLVARARDDSHPTKP